MGRAPWTGSLELRLLTFFSVEVLAAALHSPMVTVTIPQWVMVLQLWGCRYYFFPMLAFVLCLLSLATTERRRAMRWIATGLLCLVPIGAVRNWKDYPELHLAEHYSAFREAALQLESAARGTEMQFPENPTSRWRLVLVKH